MKKADVQTKSGTILGHIIDFVMQTDNTQIIKIHVAARIFIPGIYKNQLVIHKDQIISITEDKIIVEDNAVGSKVREGAAKKVEGVEKVEPAITSKGE